MNGELSQNDRNNEIINKDCWIVYFSCSKFKDADKWCRENCRDKYHLGMSNPFYFKFTNKEDALQFKLVWG